MKVLLVTGERDVAPYWARGAARGFELRHAPSVRAAAEQLRVERVDAVVINADLVEDGERRVTDSALTRLRRSAPGAALLIATDAAVTESLATNPLVDGLLPAQAPPEVQAQLVRLAAERATLSTALHERDTELDRIERELHDSRAQFRDVIERNADAIVVVDRDGAIRFANNAAAQLFHSARDALVGSRFGFPMVAGETTELDVPHNGDTRVVEMRVVESAWDGAPACIASLRDITERKHAEEDARRLIREQTGRNVAEQTARRFRFLAEASTVLASSLDYRTTLAALARLCVDKVADWAVIYMADERGRVHRLEVAHRDPARMEAVRDLRASPIDPDGRNPVIEVLRTGTPKLLRSIDAAGLRAITQDETHLELTRQLGVSSLMIVPLIARDRCLGAISLVSADRDRPYDEHDLAQAQDLALRAALAVDNARLYHDARQANQSKTDLLAVISHDLRTPLNAIMGYAELLEMGIPDVLSEASVERVGRIRTSARHLLYLIDELLSFARLDGGREQVRLQDVDACAIARDVAAVVEPLAAQRNLRFVLAVGMQPVLLQTDPDKLRQVLLNLAANAVKYTREGEIQLEVREDGADHVILGMRDTGVGISAAHLPHIFEPFWQVDATQRNSDNGTGLGLSVVQRLARLLGGDVVVESQPGVGSTFTVSLPRTPAAATDVAQTLAIIPSFDLPRQDPDADEAAAAQS